MMLPTPQDGHRPRLTTSAPDRGGEAEFASPHLLAPHPAMPQTLAPSPTLGAILMTIRRRWILALVLGVLAGAVTAVSAWTLVPESKYQVRAMVHLSAVRETILGNPNHDTETSFNYLQKT